MYSSTSGQKDARGTPSLMAPSHRDTFPLHHLGTWHPKQKDSKTSTLGQFPVGSYTVMLPLFQHQKPERNCPKKNGRLSDMAFIPLPLGLPYDTRFLRRVEDRQTFRCSLSTCCTCRWKVGCCIDWSDVLMNRMKKNGNACHHNIKFLQTNPFKSYKILFLMMRTMMTQDWHDHQ